MQETLSPSEVAALRQQAAQGDVVLQYKLGCLFKLFPHQGKPREFHDWLALAAEAGHADACWELAEAYLMEELVPPDDAEAHQWLKRGAALNQVHCLYNLGVQYAHGSGVAKDDQLAYAYTRRGAELNDAPSLYNMVMFHAKGVGVTKDFAAACGAHCRGQVVTPRRGGRSGRTIAIGKGLARHQQPRSLGPVAGQGGAKRSR